MGGRSALATEVLGRGPDRAEPMTERILDACYAELLVGGARHLSVESVARRAGTARVTIYRRFASKADLVNAVILREGRRLFAEADVMVAGAPSAEDQFVEGFVAMLTLTRRHPLVQRILADEPELLLPLATTAGQPVIALARDYLAAHLRRANQTGGLRVGDPEPVAELMVRLTLSFLLLPDSCIALETVPEARRFARRYLLPMLESA